jgi:hypothetical protein
MKKDNKGKVKSTKKPKVPKVPKKGLKNQQNVNIKINIGSTGSSGKGGKGSKAPRERMQKINSNQPSFRNQIPPPPFFMNSQQQPNEIMHPIVAPIQSNSIPMEITKKRAISTKKPLKILKKRETHFEGDEDSFDVFHKKANQSPFSIVPIPIFKSPFEGVPFEKTDFITKKELSMRKRKTNAYNILSKDDENHSRLLNQSISFLSDEETKDIKRNKANLRRRQLYAAKKLNHHSFFDNNPYSKRIPTLYDHLPTVPDDNDLN